MSTQRKAGDVIHVIAGKGRNGYYWFEAPEDYREGDVLPFGTPIHGPFATEAESKESQCRVLFGPQCEVKDGGMWNPAWDRQQ
jgi:hypothetical protein